MNYLLGAFKPACSISVAFSDGKTRKQVPLKMENGQTVMVPLFQSQETIAGKITVEPISGKKVDHNGIKVELLGQIEMYFDRGNFYDFTSLVRELDVPGEIYERKIFPFEFPTVEMPYETYNGVNVRLSFIIHSIGLPKDGNKGSHSFSFQNTEATQWCRCLSEHGMCFQIATVKNVGKLNLLKLSVSCFCEIEIRLVEGVAEDICLTRTRIFPSTTTLFCHSRFDESVKQRSTATTFFTTSFSCEARYSESEVVEDDFQVLQILKGTQAFQHCQGGAHGCGCPSSFSEDLVISTNVVMHYARRKLVITILYQMIEFDSRDLANVK